MIRFNFVVAEMAYILSQNPPYIHVYINVRCQVLRPPIKLKRVHIFNFVDTEGAYVQTTQAPTTTTTMAPYR